MSNVRYAHVEQAAVAPKGAIVAAPPPTATNGVPDGQGYTAADWLAALKQVTPALIVGGIVTGAAFALGGVLTDRGVRWIERRHQRARLKR